VLANMCQVPCCLLLLYTISLLHRSCDDGQEILSRILTQVWRVRETALMGERSEEGWVVRSSSAVGSTRMLVRGMVL
jgi:hypothetical protein